MLLRYVPRYISIFILTVFSLELVKERSFVHFQSDMNTVKQEQLDLFDTPQTFIVMCLARSVRHFKTAPERTTSASNNRKTRPEGTNSDVHVQITT